MLRATQLAGFGAQAVSAGAASQFFYDQIVAASLTANLDVVFDAGDSRCNPNTQTILDASGTGPSIFMGSTVASEADDPTFNGSVGSWSDTTFWSVDGGDRFAMTAPDFGATWHKNNGVFTMAAIVYMPTMTQNGVIFSSTADVTAASAGVQFRLDSTAGAIRLARSVTTTTRDVIGSTAGITMNGWNFVAIAFDEAALTQVMQINGTQESVAGTASTDTDACNATLSLMGGNNASQYLQSGAKLAAFAAWSGALSGANLTTLYNAAKVRIPAIP